MCQPGTEAFKVCPVRENTAVWLIDNDSDIYHDALKDVYRRIRFWFANDVDYYSVIHSYVNDKIEQMCDGYLSDLSSEDAAECNKFMDDNNTGSTLRWIMYHMASKGLDDEFHQLFVWNNRKQESICKKREEFNRHCIEKTKKELNALLLKTEIVIRDL